MDRTRAALLAIGLLAAVLGPVGAAAAATGDVDVDDYGYSPSQVRIEAGDRVRWTNQGSQVHTVTSDDPDADFDSGRLSNGDEYTHTFNEAGTFAYHCEIHSSMSGVVQVGAPPTTTTSSTTTTTTSSTTTTTRPVPPPTTTTSAPTTTTTVPGSSATTVTTRTPAGAESPDPTTTTAPTTTTTRPAATTTTAPPESTTTTAAETTTTTAAATTEPASPLGPEVPGPPPPQEEDGEGDLAGQTASTPRSRGSDGGFDAGILLLLIAVLGAGAFGGWTLWKLRPGNP